MLTTAVITPINHVLRSESWASKRLQSFSGKTICVQISPLINLKMLIDTAGELQKIDESMNVDATLTLSPLILPRLLTRELNAFAQIKTAGNPALVEELINIGKQIDFKGILEHDLSNAIGDIPAHRIAQTSEHLVQWQIKNIDRFAQTLIEYLTEENVFLVKPNTIFRFSREINNIKLHIEQLERRLNKLAKQSASANEQTVP
ncbi:SCP2 sterol-binding domain-containing protein [uncultured Nitrosomonas sp.]|uniref:ubiquinone biosynthesis accessory factor UbiJ n=1 Tax=uncultured Nitrosomonas sp. TaxID=156424 RepID=UPI0025D889A4|nr:SCP2 sterol-binding domain-containing protein [uncultured Nitrosomonas sp.]